MIYLLGLLDVLAGMSLAFLYFQLFIVMAWFFVVYLTIKGLMFLPELNGFVDLISVVFILIGIFGYFPIFSWVFVIWLLQKGFFALAG